MFDFEIFEISLIFEVFLFLRGANQDQVQVHHQSWHNSVGHSKIFLPIDPILITLEFHEPDELPLNLSKFILLRQYFKAQRVLKRYKIAGAYLSRR